MSIYAGLVALSSIMTVAILTYFLILERKYNRDLLSATRITFYFCLLFIVADILVAIDIKNLDQYCTQNRLQHCTKFNFLATTVLSNMGYSLVMAGVFLGSHTKGRLIKTFLERFFPVSKFSGDKNTLFFGIVFIAIGTFLLLSLINSVGGLVYLWAHMEERSLLLGSNGYFVIFQSFFMVFGSLLVYVGLRERGLFRLSVIVILLTLISFSLLGSRGDIANYLFIFMVLYHYRVRKFVPKDFVSLKSMLVGLLLFSVLIGGYVVRTPAYFDSDDIVAEVIADSGSIISEQVVGRFWKNERGSLSLAYFDENPLFYGSTYIGFFVAPIPRSIWPEKPPLEPGKYTLAMAERTISPPMASGDLPNEAQPPGVWEAYWNFGMVGLILCFCFSGYLFGRLYQFFIRHHHNNYSIMLYGNFAYFGAPWLSSNGLMELATFSVCMYVAVFLTVFFKLIYPRLKYS